MATDKYALHTTEYGTQGWDTILSGDMTILDAAIWTKIPVTLGETVAQYAPVYIHSDGKAYKAKADGAQMPCIGLALQGGIANDEILVQRVGLVTNAGWAFTPGAPVYLSMTTEGALTQTVPYKNKHLLGVPIAATQLLLLGGVGDLNWITLTTTTTTTTTTAP